MHTPPSASIAPRPVPALMRPSGLNLLAATAVVASAAYHRNQTFIPA